MWSYPQIPGWPHFFQQQFFDSVPSLVDFNCSIIFRSFHFDFMCAYLAEPLISYPLFLNLQRASRMIHLGNWSPAPSSVGFNSLIISQHLLFESSCANLATLINQDHCFQSFSRYATKALKLLLRPPLPVSITRLFQTWKPAPRVVSCKSAYANR